MLSSACNIDFIIGVPGTTLLNKNLIEEHKHIIDNIEYAFQQNGNTLFGTCKVIHWEEHRLYAYIYVDPQKNDNNRNFIVNEILTMYKNATKKSRVVR
jgi:hypothetical protein